MGEYARQWRLRSNRRGERARVTLVNPAATGVAADLTWRWDVAAEGCELTSVDAGPVQGGQFELATVRRSSSPPMGVPTLG